MEAFYSLRDSLANILSQEYVKIILIIILALIVLLIPQKPGSRD